MKTLLALCTILLLAGCSVNYSPTEIAFNQTVSGSGKGEMKTDAKGLTTAITPTQDASGSAATEGAMAALGGIKDAVANFIPAVTTTETTTTTTPLQPVDPAVPPLAPVVEEEIAEPESLEDAPAGEVIEVD